MFSINESVQKVLTSNAIKTRPKSNPGVWLAFLLPLAVNISLAKNQEVLSHQYKLATLASFGFIVTSVVWVVQCVRRGDCRRTALNYAAALYVSSLFYTCLHRGLLFSVASGLCTSFLYSEGLLLLLRLFPLSFTFGEAALVAQACVLFVYMSAVNVWQATQVTPVKTSHVSTLILQLGATGMAIIALLARRFKPLRRTLLFYTLTGTVVFLWVLLPLQLLLRRNPMLFVLQLAVGRFSSARMLIFWAVCSALAAHAVGAQVRRGRKANTAVRKVFHALAVAVFLPGLVDQCALLYLASGLVLVAFFALETLRVLELPPLGDALHHGYRVFSDEKDAGTVAFTPMYLLAGCALPLWLHPDPCDMTDSAGFNLLPLASGLLTIGVGDTLASAVGSWSGRCKWPGSNKSVEGTLACIAGQAAMVALLMCSGYVVCEHATVVKSAVAIVVSSVVEGNTSQIDNLVLPLISYLFLV